MAVIKGCPLERGPEDCGMEVLDMVGTGQPEGSTIDSATCSIVQCALSGEIFTGPFEKGFGENK